MCCKNKTITWCPFYNILSKHKMLKFTAEKNYNQLPLLQAYLTDANKHKIKRSNAWRCCRQDIMLEKFPCVTDIFLVNLFFFIFFNNFLSSCWSAPKPNCPCQFGTFDAESLVLCDTMFVRSHCHAEQTCQWSSCLRLAGVNASRRLAAGATVCIIAT